MINELTPATRTRGADTGSGAATYAAARPRDVVHLVRDNDTQRIGLMFDADEAASLPGVVSSLPPCYPEWLGDHGFLTDHGARFPYIGGEMANGIATTRMVMALAEIGAVGVFGAAGLAPAAVEHALSELSARLSGRRNWGVNLIHSPAEPDVERRVADLLLAWRVPIVSLSAFLALTPTAVLCSAKGLTADSSGRVVRQTRVIAKVSRPEVAEQFMAPAPEEMLAALVAEGALTESEAALARLVPVAQDVTAEADSGGHTDNRPLGALLPALLALRDEVAISRCCPPVRVGAAGGLGTPSAVAAAFAAGAAYVVTGSVNQSAVESGLSLAGRELLAQADIADVCMAPASDMFEMGVSLQVLRRGSLFAGRAARLREIFRAYDSLESIPDDVRGQLERGVLGEPVAAAWASTRKYWEQRDPREVERAEREARHRMALVFRSYLGRASRWAITGDESRRADYQIWCGPAMGSFNRWVRGTFLEPVSERTVAQIALNLLEGATVVTRAQQLRTAGVNVAPEAFVYRPRPLA
ncbi:PfaD family polyunsaturated fatty acid/polyketide biosynthesis protein [Lentzea sp. NPDC042327]|uniref:PfaD family polyunsaturated fatty acid/polyketide biosynthesis protein n=1 Tax=Lentzea sp. NPDC042327 TaxID=3154801 RepID=UPI003400C69B